MDLSKYIYICIWYLICGNILKAGLNALLIPRYKFYNCFDTMYIII